MSQRSSPTWTQHALTSLALARIFTLSSLSFHLREIDGQRGSASHKGFKRGWQSVAFHGMIQAAVPNLPMKGDALAI